MFSLVNLIPESAKRRRPRSVNKSATIFVTMKRVKTAFLFVFSLNKITFERNCIKYFIGSQADCEEILSTKTKKMIMND